MKVTSLIEELKHYLREQSYRVIFDDVWDKEFWECIKYSFLENDKGSRIIITTRYEDVAPPRSESLDYYVYKLSPYLSKKPLSSSIRRCLNVKRGNVLLNLLIFLLE